MMRCPLRESTVYMTKARLQIALAIHTRGNVCQVIEVEMWDRVL